MRKTIKNIFIIMIIFTTLIFTTNLYVIFITNKKIKTIETLNSENIDCVLILGAGIRGTNPSPMLEDRLLTGMDIYNKKITNKIIVSGDHGRENYDEVNVMKNFLISHKISSENIFMDHAGFSTYDSIYRAKEIFKAKKIIIVTQKYHLYRALYIAKELGIEAYGIEADKRTYKYQLKREIREIAARVKDLIKCIIKPEPKYLGNTIPVNGNGDLTNDK